MLLHHFLEHIIALSYFVRALFQFLSWLLIASAIKGTLKSTSLFFSLGI